MSVEKPRGSVGSSLLFVGGIAVGSALAFGAAYGVTTYYLAQLPRDGPPDGLRSRRSTRSMSQPQPGSPARTSSALPGALPPLAPLNTAPLHRLAGQTPREAVAAAKLQQHQQHSQQHNQQPHHTVNSFSKDPVVVVDEYLPVLAGRTMRVSVGHHGVDLAPPRASSAPSALHPAASFSAGSAVTLAPGGGAPPDHRQSGGGGLQHDKGSERGGSGGAVPAKAPSAVAAFKEAHLRKSMSLSHHGSGGSGTSPVLAMLATASSTLSDLPGPEGDMEEYSRVITPEPPPTDEMEEVASLMVECMELRRKWLFKPSRIRPSFHASEPEAAVPSDINAQPLEYRPVPASRHTYRMVDGVMHLYGEDCAAVGGLNQYPVPGSASEFFTDMHRVLRYGAMGPVKSFCHHRLMLLEQKFNLHVMLNSDKEFLAQKAAPHRDFYNVRKVDTHIHHSACMHQKHLLRFIKSKLRKEPDEVVIFRDGKYLTLKEVFESLKMTGYDLNVDTLDMHADKNMFHRFDRFNLKYNPCGQSRLREIFIKQDNLIHGRFLAELTQEVFQDYEASKYQHAELRISVYGRKAMEWDILASWIVANKLYSDNVVWLIQIPRLYNIYKETGVIDNFQQMLDNLFEPLFEVTRDPASHPQLHVFLGQVTGFDMVDDESKPERRPTKHCPLPLAWDSKHNCAYAYYAYYIYANLYVLNKFREERGFNTFTFRPHAGEAGDIDHLTTAFMLCENIAHGINLRKSPCLQYLYYLGQIGLCMSPLSNNSLFLDYHRNPFPAFFARGLNVSLSTDDPLQIHLTKEPLVEEYSVAAQVYKLSSADLCEIARSGVLHSGFPAACKKHWVAERFWEAGPAGNDIHKTNVPNLRLRYRSDTYLHELRLVYARASSFHARKAVAKENW